MEAQKVKSLSVAIAAALVAMLVGAVIVSAQEGDPPSGDGTIYAEYGLACPKGDQVGVIEPWGGTSFETLDAALAAGVEASSMPAEVVIDRVDVAPALAQTAEFGSGQAAAYSFSIEGTVLAQAVFSQTEAGWGLESLARCSAADAWHLGTASPK